MSCLTLFPGMAWASCLWPSAGPLVINSERVASLLYFPLLYHSPLVFFTILVYLFPALQKGEPTSLLKIYRVWTGLKYLHLGSSYIHPTFLPIHLKSVQYECNIAYTCKWECQIHLRVHCMDCWIGLDCCQVILFLKKNIDSWDLTWPMTIQGFYLSFWGSYLTNWGPSELFGDPTGP